MLNQKSGGPAGWLDDVRAVGTALSTPGGWDDKWHALRQSVKHGHPELWFELQELRRFQRDWTQEANRYGVGRVARREARRLSRKFKSVTSPEAIRHRLRPKRSSPIVWLDMGDFGELLTYDVAGTFQDHGLGLLRTIMHRDGLYTDLASTRSVHGWDEVRSQLAGYDILIMNVRSYHYPRAVVAAKLFKEVNPNGLVITGGMHATVSPEVMEATECFDRICIGPGERIICDLVRNPHAYPRVFQGEGSKSMAEWPEIDRTLWPKPAGALLRTKYNWPLEPGFGWGERPVATMLTSRVCPWQCSFCNESSYIANMGRRPVDMIIDELNRLDRNYEVNSVVFHDSMFFQQPPYLKEFIEKYPKKSHRPWPYWAAGRADTVRQWPDLFEKLVKETNWHTISIGFESGSDPVLRILNKECTEEDNNFTIDLLNRIGDEYEDAGRDPPYFWSNIMLAIPGENQQDAIKTLRMLKRMKRVVPSLAFYAPYPGSALGHQIIAEGKSLVETKVERNPHDEKVKGVDYDFYRELLLGRYDDQINDGLDPESRDRDITLVGGNKLADLVVKA